MSLRVPALIAIALLAAGCGSGRAETPAKPPVVPRIDGLRLPARVQGTQIAAAAGGRFQPRFWAGVNLGSTVPGHLPGELAATRADYDRWLRDMGRLGATVVRVYTILRPDFYDALRAYDLAHPARPIRVIQGVWIPEEQFLSTQNAYDPSVTGGFKAELRDAVAVVHGDADIPGRPGHASGRYRSDIAPWLLAWSIGIEWDPTATAATDRTNAGTPPFRGRYFRASADATPMESWLASMLDYTAGLEAARGWSRPMTFTNWLTTDPLHHPYEPLATEDMVSIDAMHITATRRWPGGFFASYHIYPYYPDFLGLTPRYRHGDPYAAFLAQLRAHHRGQAVMITEFGVPTGIGIAHRGPDGRDQGGHTELAAGRMDAAMLRDIQREGYAGGVLFEWMDEWFKLTWNTVDLQLPAARRQLWDDAMTNEQHFGVMAADPAGQPADGGQVIEHGGGPVREVRAAKDEEYLYLRLRFDRSDGWRSGPFGIGFDVRPGGNRGLPGMPGVDPAADVALTIARDGTARIEQAASTDPISFMYGPAHHFVPFRRADLRPGSGAWVHPRLILDRPYTVPVTGRPHPTELADVSRLAWGDWSEPMHLIRASGDELDVRIPWHDLTYSDPSSNRIWVTHVNGTISSEHAGPIGIAVEDGGLLTQTAGFGWKPWNTVAWHERRKAGWSAIQAAIAAVSREP
jgi:hypothetical protein